MAISLPVLDVLDTISIPTHCPVPWDEMQGDDRTRFCNQCRERVYDISEMTTAEAVTVLSETGKQPCLRIYRRADGRVMTADCPANARERLWRWLRRRSAWAGSLFALVFLSGCRMTTQGAMHRDYGEAIRNSLPQTPQTTEQPPVAQQP